MLFPITLLVLMAPFLGLANPLLQARQLGSCATAPCAPGLCCSEYNFCGTGEEYCQAGSCVGGVGGTCAGGQCCSEFGYCGSGEGYCPPTSSSSSSSSSASATPTPVICANQWNQCAGTDWAGATCCNTPYTCTYYSVWYSQCE